MSVSTHATVVTTSLTTFVTLLHQEPRVQPSPCSTGLIVPAGSFLSPSSFLDLDLCPYYTVRPRGTPDPDLQSDHTEVSADVTSPSVSTSPTLVYSTGRRKSPGPGVLLYRLRSCRLRDPTTSTTVDRVVATTSGSARYICQLPSRKPSSGTSIFTFLTSDRRVSRVSTPLPICVLCSSLEFISR